MTGGEIRRIHVAGRDLVAKSATGRGREHLRKEAELLRALAGPGVPELVALRDADDRTDLITADAGATDLARLRRDPTDTDDAQLVAVLADVATILAAVHSRGWVHGAVCAEHVVVAGRPTGPSSGPRRSTLCSWGSARPATGSEVDNEVDDLRRLVRSTLSDRHRHPLQDPAGRIRRARLLRQLDEAPGGSAAAVAAVLDAQAFPTQRTRWTPARARWARPQMNRGTWSLPPQWGRRLPHFGVTLSLMVLLGVSAFAMWPRGDALAASEPVRLAAPPPACPDVGRLSADLDGDGCRGEVLVTDNAVTADGVSFTVGRPGDRLAVGDWTCDGAVTVRLLRPSTGELFEFDGWAPGAGETRGRLIGTAESAVDLTVVTEAECDTTLLVSATGEEVVAS